MYPKDMTNYSSGHYAEQIAVEHLKSQGYKALDVNWKSKMAEIDIVAQKGEVVIFFEVKHRKTAWQGSGLDYITPAKYNQMQFAAKLWVHMHGYAGEYSLGAVELTGENYEVTAVLDEL